MSRPVIVAFLCVGLLSACSEARKTLGLDHAAPDEFRVVSRAPLVMPPDFNLRPPAPGSANLGLTSPSSRAADAILGPQNKIKTAKPIGKLEQKILTMTGGDVADPLIRTTLDRETAQLIEANKTILDRIRNFDPTAITVDANAEKQRLEKNKEQGLPANAGEIPMIKPKKKGLFEK
jgi:hypothetical protein